MIGKKQLILIIAKNLLITALAVSLALLAVIYSSRQMNKISNSISDKKKISYVLEKRSETYTNLKRDFAILGDADKAIETALIPSDDISGFLSAIESLGTQSNVSQSYRFGNPVPAGNGELALATIDYSLNLKTSLSGLTVYLRNFEGMPYFSGILNLNMVSGSARGVGDTSDISLNAKLYAKQSI